MTTADRMRVAEQAANATRTSADARAIALAILALAEAVLAEDLPHPPRSPACDYAECLLADGGDCEGCPRRA